MKEDKQTKSNVLRLSDQELRLINAIREVGIADFLTELQTVARCPGSPLNTKLRHVAIRTRNFNLEHLSMDYCISCGFFSQQQADELMEAVSSGASIIVTGNQNSGKSTLVRTLLELDVLRNKKVGIIDSVHEIYSDEEYEEQNLLSFREDAAINLEDLKELKDGVLVIGELTTPTVCLSFLNSLCVGKRVIATDYRSDDWKTSFLGQFNNDASFKAFAERTLNESRIFLVELKRLDSGQRRCEEVGYL